MKDNCITVLCLFLPNTNMNQPLVYIHWYTYSLLIGSAYSTLLVPFGRKNHDVNHNPNSSYYCLVTELKLQVSHALLNFFWDRNWVRPSSFSISAGILKVNHVSPVSHLPTLEGKAEELGGRKTFAGKSLKREELVHVTFSQYQRVLFLLA